MVTLSLRVSRDHFLECSSYFIYLPEPPPIVIQLTTIMLIFMNPTEELRDIWGRWGQTIEVGVLERNGAFPHVASIQWCDNCHLHPRKNKLRYQTLPVRLWDVEVVDVDASSWEPVPMETALKSLTPLTELFLPSVIEWFGVPHLLRNWLVSPKSSASFWLTQIFTKVFTVVFPTSQPQINHFQGNSGWSLVHTPLRLWFGPWR